nr:uncharacterized protein LOC128695299 [Cherax quadricarinatus]
MLDSSFSIAYMKEDPRAPGGKVLWFKGLLVQLLDYIAHSINFTYSFVTPADGSSGNINSDGRWSGIVGMVMREEADLSGSPLTVTASRSQVLDMTMPVMWSYLTFVGSLGRPEIDPWGFVLPFTPVLWLIVFVSMFIMMATMLALSSFPSIMSPGRKTWLDKSLNFLKILLQQDFRMVGLWWWERVLWLVWLLVNLLLSRSYCGNLMSYLAVRYIPKHFPTLQDFLDDPSAKLIWQRDSSTEEYIRSRSNTLLDELADLENKGRVVRKSVTELENSIEQLVKPGTHLLLFFDEFLFDFLGDEFSKSDNVDRLALLRGAVTAVLEAASQQRCSLILFTDGATILSSVLKEESQLWSPWGVAVFQVAVLGQDANETQTRLSRVVAQARWLRQESWCVTVVVVSDNADFLATFAECSLKGRLLVWSTRLLAVTSLPLLQLQQLLSTHWTFSMMNAAFLNKDDIKGFIRWSLYIYQPYTDTGVQTHRTASWTPRRGLQLYSTLPLFPEKYMNFHGTVVNVTALPYTPHWVEETVRATDGTLTKKYTGMDYLLLATIAHTLNFTINVLPTDSWDEVARRVEERVSYMATVFHNVLPQRLERYDFSFTYEYGSLDFCAAKPALKPQWQSLYYPLSDGVWLSVLAAVIIMPFVFYMVNVVGCMSTDNSKTSVVTVFQLVITPLLSQPLTKELSSATSNRLLLVTWLVFAFLVGNVYRGNLTAALTLPKYPPRVETVEQLVKTFPRITMPPFGDEFIKFFKQSNSILYKSLAEHMTIVPTVIDGLQQAKDKKEAHVGGRRYMEQMIASYFSQADGTTDLYVGRESILPGISAWPIPHDAPYTQQINRLMMAVVEAGLYEKWNQDMLTAARKKSRMKQSEQEKEDDSQQQVTSLGDQDTQSDNRIGALNLVHMQAPFILLLLGFVIGSILFITEVTAGLCH